MKSCSLPRVATKTSDIEQFQICNSLWNLLSPIEMDLAESDLIRKFLIKRKAQKFSENFCGNFI